jgi:hypothetical protein
VFQDSLNVLRKAAKTGLAALYYEIDALRQQLEDYHLKGVFEGEEDEFGNLVWSRDQHLERNIEDTYNSLMELRKTFAIAAYHYWERSVLEWIEQASREIALNDPKNKTKILKHDDLLEKANELGYPAASDLSRVVALANTLKHNSTNYGQKLVKLWPELFSTNFQEPFKYSSWASSVQLSDQQLNEVFDIISKSGPTSFPAPIP